MQTGMLGNSEELRQIWDGPLKDLVLKLNGGDGPEVLTELKKFNRREPCWVPKQEDVRADILKPQIIIPNLRQTGPTLAEWLKAREEMHRFLIGETLVLTDIFALTDDELASTTLMPAFRPAGATNQTAVDWMRRMGTTVFVEDENKGGVMRHKNSKGPSKPELYLINRSIRPDEDTLGDNAKSPDELVKIQNKLWLDLFGWCDADTLHHAVMAEHLDPETWTWFPNERLPGGSVASGRWRPGYRRVRLGWRYSGYRYPRCGARSARKVPLRQKK
ncbi:MAG: hypothetical protein Q8P52_02695 [bacterium]|nr:hypothetical protein [bacterium]